MTTPTDAPAVRVRGLTKRYGTRTAVGDLSIEIPSGVVAGFVGPNGAGKTTTMAMILGLVRPTAGEGTVLGHSIADPAAYLGRVGALIEGPAFYPALSGRRNLEVVATIARHDTAQIGELLELVGLAGRAEDPYRGYSLGMKQRLGLAAALLGDPRLLILDEPTNGLDPSGVAEMRQLIAGLSGAGRTVLVSSHDLSELEHVCDWLVVVDHGRLVYQGPTAQLTGRGSDTIAVAPERPDDLAELARLVAAAGHDGRVEGAELVVRVNGHEPRRLAADVNRAAAAGDVVLAELRANRTTLEDRYLALVATKGDA